jgi:hypothetical protein
MNSAKKLRFVFRKYVLIVSRSFGRDIFIFDGGNKRLRNVTNLCCQCQISQRRS